MKFLLTEMGRIEKRASGKPVPTDGMVALRVDYCGVCRTDAKMWNEGHRDLVLPRVPGHEVCARDGRGQLFTLWPATACGRCRYCLAGRENLCESMMIMGFHFDGGFSDALLAPASSLIPIPASVPSHLTCFAEPLGCVLNALDKLELQPAERVAVFGGGTVGLIAALAAKTRGAVPLVIEKSENKIAKASSFLKAEQVACVQKTAQGDFDAVINACPDPMAFCQALDKLARGGRFAFFSGLAKERHIAADLVNRIHYKEATVCGAYGLTRRNMAAALDIIVQHPAAFGMLVEAIVPPEDLSEILPQVLAGSTFKFILDFTGSG